MHFKMHFQTIQIVKEIDKHYENDHADNEATSSE